MNAAPCRMTAELYENCALFMSVQFAWTWPPSYTFQFSWSMYCTDHSQSKVSVAHLAYVSF